MNQFLTGSAALIIALFLWGLGKKSRGGLLGNQVDILKANLELEKLSLFHFDKGPSSNPNIHSSPSTFLWEPPRTPQEQKNLRKKLFRLIESQPDERLEAITIAGLWGHASLLPILRRGLKDSDSRVVLAAATAIQTHKGGPAKPFGTQESVRPPRNVALMR